VVAAPTLRRATWTVVVVAAAGTIVVLAFHGRRPDPSLARFEPAGIMLAIAPETVVEVALSRGRDRWRFTRAGVGAWKSAAGPPLAEDRSARLDSGLRLLHGSKPQRILQPEEIAGVSPSEYGLAPPRYSVSVRAAAGPAFEVEFGALSPQGQAQYARVIGHAEVLLLPSFVGEQWEVVMGAP